MINIPAKQFHNPKLTGIKRIKQLNLGPATYHSSKNGNPKAMLDRCGSAIISKLTFTNFT